MKNKILTSFSLLAAINVFTALASNEVTYYKDIRPVIEDRCLGCHSDKGVSFSFEDPENTYLFKDAIVSAVGLRRMPPWLAEPGHQSYVEDESLSESTLKKFLDWKANGFKKGTPIIAAGTDSKIKQESNFKAHLSLNVLPNGEYLPNQKSKDDYRCFVVDWPTTKDTYVTGFKTIPGNLKVAHHLVAFVIEPETAHMFKDLEKQEQGHGYQCFGGAIPDRLNEEAEKEAFEKKYPNGLRKLQDSNFWLAHWAPGMDGYSFPENSGILVRPGSLIILQMHYYSAFAPGETDSNTKIEFQIADHVGKPSIHYPLTKNKWLYAEHNNSMVIEPGEKAAYETNISFQRIAKRMSQFMRAPIESIDALELHSANIHMHAFGASGKAYLTDTNGNKETLL
ncbi:MAG: hypothetical protein OQK04_12375, partial [Kangiellaceae bacterium]|nr:hypothetical protein [Kangiellaceae bacterium]